MREPIAVLVLGTGQMGSGIARLVLRKRGLRLAGAYCRRQRRAGTDLGIAIGVEKTLGLPLDHDLSHLLTTTRPDIAIQATCSRAEEAWGEIEQLLIRGVNVISIAEEMAYPCYAAPALAERMDKLARSHGVAVLGTGVNPGFILDLLVILLSGACADIRRIQARRVNDLSPYGPSVLASQGVGLSPEAFAAGVADGTVAGHIGFPESLHLIADSLGWAIQRIEQQRKPIISRTSRLTPFISIKPGQVAGCHHTAVAYVDGEAVIRLDHPQQVLPGSEGVITGDFIEIHGTPDIHLAGTPEIPGGEATAALAVNMIPRVLNASPGLHNMADLPVPGALLGDARMLLNDRKRDGHD